ncbi:MAG: T9SS type A sorting domain-containing protein, partial [Saprospiraceae bacterium]
CTPNDPMLLGGLQDNGNFFVNSTDPTAPWKQTVNGDGSFGAVAPGKAYYVLSIQKGRVAKVVLDDDGNVLAFRRIDPIGPKKDDYSFINPLALDPSDANVLYLPAGNRLYRQTELASINLTGEWDSIAQGWMQYPDTIKASFGFISAVAVSTANPTHRVYIGTSANKLYRIDDAHTGSPAFISLGTPPVGSSGYVTCIAVDPDNADRVVVAYSNYNIYSLFLSTNAGQTWLKVGGNLEANLAGNTGGVSVRWISILPFANGSHQYFCGTSLGLFSADTLKIHTMTAPGTQWALEGASTLGSAVVDYIETRTSDGLVVAATHGSGMFTANFAPVSGTNGALQKDYVHVYPNPASDFVQIDLGDKYNGTPAAFRLFDQRGQEVRRLNIVSGNRRIDLQGLPSGVYLYDLQGVGWRKSGKVMKSN